MAATRFHFVDDYRALVCSLLTQYPLDEAMSRAVGGSYDALGEIEKQLLILNGLHSAHTRVDVGCSSGRLEKALVPSLTQGRVLGTDVVPELLDYAAEGCPASWQFKRVDDVRIPFSDNCADFACFFSVFTHLLHEETYCYLLEAQRVVKPGGRIVFSFLEFADNWPVFEGTYETIRAGNSNVHLNVFISRDAIQSWAGHLGMSVVEIREAFDAFIPLSRSVELHSRVKVEGKAWLRQSICVLANDKPAPSATKWSMGARSNVSYKTG